MPRPIHFDMTAEEPERAVRFYGDVFGWQFHKWDGPMDYWLITTGKDDPGIDGGLAKRNEGQNGVMNTIGVPSVDEYLERITSAGGQVIMPKDAIPGVGWFAACADPDGNQFGIMQDDPEAK
jgi:predicted enzyme related to lactoylglutathione lyase